MEYAVLNNGVEMPMIGYGTCQTSPAVTERCVADALSVGYRSIDTAQCYGNEREVGAGCRKSGISRDELFITTKLWAVRGYKNAAHSIDESVRRLGLEYIDLLLIHEPTGDIPEIYRAMEEALGQGKARAIGVSNFRPDIFRDLLAACTVVPAANQVETHVFRQQKELRRIEMEVGTRAESWSPLASSRNGIFRNPVLHTIASEIHKSVSLVALRFLVQQGIIVIPKSMNLSHMRENLDVLNFSPNDEQIHSIKELDAGESLFGWW